MGRFGDEKVEQHLRELYDAQNLRTEGLAASKLEGGFATLENDESGFHLAFDGLNGLARTDSGELLYVPTLKIIEGIDRFIGLTIFHEEDKIPYTRSRDYEPLTTRGFIKSYACKKSQFTSEAWQEYKNEINKQRAIRTGAGLISITALGLSAGVLWRRKHK